jgi:hypothetical protein
VAPHGADGAATSALLTRRLTLVAGDLSHSAQIGRLGGGVAGGGRRGSAARGGAPCAAAVCSPGRRCGAPSGGTRTRGDAV